MRETLYSKKDARKHFGITSAETVSNRDDYPKPEAVTVTVTAAKKLGIASLQGKKTCVPMCVCCLRLLLQRGGGQSRNELRLLGLPYGWVFAMTIHAFRPEVPMINEEAP